MPAGLSYGNWQPKPLLSRKCCRALNNTAINNQDCLNVSFIKIFFFFIFLLSSRLTIHILSKAIFYILLLRPSVYKAIEKNKMISAAFDNFSEDSYAICAICLSFCFLVLSPSFFISTAHLLL